MPKAHHHHGHHEEDGINRAVGVQRADRSSPATFSCPRRCRAGRDVLGRVVSVAIGWRAKELASPLPP